MEKTWNFLFKKIIMESWKYSGEVAFMVEDCDRSAYFAILAVVILQSSKICLFSCS